MLVKILLHSHGEWVFLACQLSLACIMGYSTPSDGECFLMKSPKLVAFKGVSLEDTGNTYNVAQLKKDLEKNGASLVSDILYLVDKDHTEQWSLVQ